MERTIQQAVAEKIQQSGETVANIVINKLADIEINTRVEIITQAIAKQDEVDKAFKKINRNDIVTYVDGKAVEAMSKTRFDEIAKVKGQKEKLTVELNTALESNTAEAYSKLSQTIKSLSNVGGNQKESSANS